MRMVRKILNFNWIERYCLANAKTNWKKQECL